MAPLHDLSNGQWQRDEASGDFGEWGKTWLGDNPDPLPPVDASVLNSGGGGSSGQESSPYGSGYVGTPSAEQQPSLTSLSSRTPSVASTSSSGSAFVSLSSMAGMIAKGKQRASSIGSNLDASLGAGLSAHNPLQEARAPLLTVKDNEDGHNAKNDQGSNV